MSAVRHRRCFTMFGVLLLVAIVVLLTNHALCTYERLNGVQCCNNVNRTISCRRHKEPKSRRRSNTAARRVGVWCLEDCQTSVDAWYDMIVNAKDEILISMYHWVVYRQGEPAFDVKDESVITPHLIVLGLALRRLQQNRHRQHNTSSGITVRILFDLDAYRSVASSEHRIAQTVSMWRDMGVCFDDSAWAWEFMVWRERFGDNMHSKMLIVDRKAVWAGSGNVQFSTHEGHPRWGDNGVVLYSVELAQRAARYFDRLAHGRVRSGRDEARVFSYHQPASWGGNNAATSTTTMPTQPQPLRHFFRKGCGPDARYKLACLDSFKPRLSTVTDWERSLRERIRSHKPESTHYCALRDVEWMHSFPCNGVWNTKWCARFDGLVRAFRQARHSIAVFSPNVNQPTLWRELVAAARRGVQVRIVTGRAFNNKNALLYKWGAGFRSNAEMYERIAKPLLDNKPNLPLEWRWYGYNGKMMVGQSPKSAHEKMFFIDNDLVGVGSLNFTTVSIHNCSEVLILLRSPAIYRVYYERFYKQHWRQSHAP